MKKLLLIGSGTVHTYNYYRLIEGYFDQLRLITDKIIPGNDDIDILEGNFVIRNPIKALANIRFLKKQIRQFNPDIIHVQQANSTAWLTLRAALKSGIPVIVSTWGSDILEFPKKNNLLKRMVIYILKHADAFTADAEIVVDRMKELYPALDKEVTIANFGIEPFYKDIPKENIVYSNRLHRKLYRIDTIIRAFNYFISNQTKEWKLVIAGENVETEKLKKLTNDLGLDQSVEFIGWVDRKINNEYYNKALIFVSIPSSDATAISLLEAMHAGCIPVVADLPASHEWIEDGINGVIVKSLEENFLQRALELDAQKVKSINQEIINKKGLKSVNRDKFIKLYKQILAP
jgi:glycosyltransferase involved in cell wall biosynthesis